MIRTSSFTGGVLRVGVPQSFKIPEVFHHVFRMIAYELGVTIDWIPLFPPPNTTLFDFLISGEVDCFGDPWGVTKERLDLNLSFSAPITTFDLVFIVPRHIPSIWERAVAITEVFDVSLWILNLVIIAVLVALAAFQDSIMNRFECEVLLLLTFGAVLRCVKNAH